MTKRAIGKTSAILAIAGIIVVASAVGITSVLLRPSNPSSSGISQSTSNAFSVPPNTTAPTGGMLTVSCSNCSPEIGSSQYVATVGWNIPSATSADDNVSQYQAAGNGTSSYMVTWQNNQYTGSELFVNWNVQMQSRSGGTLQVSFTLDNGLVTYCGTTTLFPDIVQGNYSASDTYSQISCPPGESSTRSVITDSFVQSTMTFSSTTTSSTSIDTSIDTSVLTTTTTTITSIRTSTVVVSSTSNDLSTLTTSSSSSSSSSSCDSIPTINTSNGYGYESDYWGGCITYDAVLIPANTYSVNTSGILIFGSVAQELQAVTWFPDGTASLSGCLESNDSVSFLLAQNNPALPYASYSFAGGPYAHCVSITVNPGNEYYLYLIPENNEVIENVTITNAFTLGSP